MCGVTGWIDFETDLRHHGEVVEAMTRTLVPRGPDDAGTWVSEHAALGHRRLAIIDLAGGTQPMLAHDADGEVIAALTYSGEVYNYRELRTELERLGHAFLTRSDTEVVLRAHLEWGAAAAEHLNGMFAYGYWDARAQELLLVRDRLGVKPLYWAQGPARVLFGSEPKAVLANPRFEAELDAAGIAELFALATGPTPGNGVYRGLHQVRPGHRVVFSRAGAREERWWSLTSGEHVDDPDATVAHVRQLIAEAVGRQLDSDVPLGFLLSGGVDSSAIVALAHEVNGNSPPDTYSVAFPPGEGPEQQGDWIRSEDAPYVDAVVRHVGSDHREVVVPGSELLAHRDIGLDARDLPGWGEPDTSLYLLFRGVRSDVTVALSGEVADEVFGGYVFFHDGKEGPVREFPWLNGGHDSPTSLLRADVAAEVQPEAYARARLEEALDEVPALPGESPRDARARQLSYLAFTRWLPAVLERKDRMSMATGLEARVPFADHHLVEYVWNVPWQLKTMGNEPKGLLRQAVGDSLPTAVLRRPKSGYPATTAAGYETELRRRVEELTRRDARVFDLVDRDAVLRHLRDGTRIPGPRAAPHPTGGLDFLLAVDRWLERYEVRIR
jgi:asparagine synthase (glutamine-hydrolysing)